uniref:Uncharacterized protein n=1 Tax=Avena sativa TaxID=4498 RepID=A0ACD5UQ30_AVESA
MEEKAADVVAAPAVAAVAADLDVAYCSEHPYPPGAAAAAAGMAVGSGICAFCLQEKLGMLVSSSKSSPFHPPPSSVTPTTPPSNRPASETLQPSAAAAGTAIPPSQKAKSSSSSAATVASGLRRSKSVAPRPEEPQLSSGGITSDSPRKKSFWSFLYQSSSSSRSHRSASSSSLGSDDGGAASARRKSVSVASATSASLGRRLEAIEEPESPGRRSEGSSSSSFGRKVARSRSVGCGSRSFSGDFLERLSTGFGDCALRRVESHREPKPKGSAALGHLGGAGDGTTGDDDYEYAQQHRIKCAGFFGGLGAAPPPSSSYWLSAPNSGGSSSASSTKAPGTRSHRSWAWALASPMRALRPTSSTSSSKTIMSAHHNRPGGNNGGANMPTGGGSAVATS